MNTSEFYSLAQIFLEQLKINPELEICLGERNLKFHHSSLEEVIKIEKKEMAL